MKQDQGKTRLFSGRQIAFGLAWVMVIAWILIRSQGAWAQTITGTIVGVSDGDTVTLLLPNKEQVKIRVQGIDAPEKSQAFGQKSRQAMASMVFQRQVYAMCPETDRYGRKICMIFVDQTDAGLSLIEQGLAWHYKQYAKNQRPNERTSYALAQEKAQAQGRGLWADNNPTPPWEFRRNK